MDSPLAASLDLPSNLYHAVYSQFFVHEQLASYPPELKDPGKTLDAEFSIRHVSTRGSRPTHTVNQPRSGDRSHRGVKFQGLRVHRQLFAHDSCW